MVRRAWVSTVTLAVLLVSAAFGCGNLSARNDPGTITWWVPSPTPQPGTLKDAAQRFTEQTGVKVDIDEYPWSTYLTKLTTAIVSSNGPDIADIGNTWAPNLSRGFYQWSRADLAKIGGANQFYGNVMQVGAAPGAPTTSIPFNAQSWVMLYNKKMFRQAGIKAPPATWRELVTDAKKMTDSKHGIYGVATSAAGAPTAGTMDWVIATQNGGTLLTPDYKTATLNSPKTVEALTNWIQWVAKDNIMAPRMTTDSTGTIADLDFENGKAAIDITQNVEPAIKDPKNTGLALIPLTHAGATGPESVMSHVAGENLAIFKYSSHVSEDIKFIKFMVSTREQIQVNKELYELPVTKAAGNNAYFQTPNERAFQKILSEHARPEPATGNANQILTAYSNAVVNLFRKAATSHHIDESEVSAALKRAEATANATTGGG